MKLSINTLCLLADMGDDVAILLLSWVPTHGWEWVCANGQVYADTV